MGPAEECTIQWGRVGRVYLLASSPSLLSSGKQGERPKWYNLQSNLTLRMTRQGNEKGPRQACWLKKLIPLAEPKSWALMSIVQPLFHPI